MGIQDIPEQALRNASDRPYDHAARARVEKLKGLLWLEIVAGAVAKRVSSEYNLVDLDTGEEVNRDREEIARETAEQVLIEVLTVIALAEAESGQAAPLTADAAEVKEAI